MEVVWSGIGFLVGMSLWLPFIIGERVGAKLALLEGRINAQEARFLTRSQRL